MSSCTNLAIRITYIKEKYLTFSLKDHDSLYVVFKRIASAPKVLYKVLMLLTVLFLMDTFLSSTLRLLLWGAFTEGGTPGYFLAKTFFCSCAMFSRVVYHLLHFLKLLR